MALGLAAVAPLHSGGKFQLGAHLVLHTRNCLNESLLLSYVDPCSVTLGNFRASH